MKLLLDECLPRKLKGALLDHEVKTVPEMGWAGIEIASRRTRADRQNCRVISDLTPRCTGRRPSLLLCEVGWLCSSGVAGEHPRWPLYQ